MEKVQNEVQAWTGPGVSRNLGRPDFMTVIIWRL